MAEPTFSDHTLIIRSQALVSSELEGEIILLNIESGLYYSLDGVGAYIWQLLQSPRTVAEIEQAILSRYNVEPDRCRRDMLALFQELEGEGLIERQEEKPG